MKSAPAQDQELPAQAKLLFTDIAKLTSSFSQHLQGSGRWFPAPQGDDQRMCQQIQALQNGTAQFQKDLFNQASLDTLKSDMDQLKQANLGVQALWPAVGGSNEVQGDWNVVQARLNGMVQHFNSIYLENNPAEHALPPDPARVLDQLAYQAQRFKTSLGQYLTMPNRVPPPHDEDLDLVNLLKQFQQQLGSLRQDLASAVEPAHIQAEMTDLTYTTTRMDKLIPIVGAGENMLQNWQGMRKTLSTANQLIGEKQASGSPYDSLNQSPTEHYQPAHAPDVTPVSPASGF